MPAYWKSVMLKVGALLMLKVEDPVMLKVWTLVMLKNGLFLMLMQLHQLIVAVESSGILSYTIGLFYHVVLYTADNKAQAPAPEQALQQCFKMSHGAFNKQFCNFTNSMQ